MDEWILTHIFGESALHYSFAFHDVNHHCDFSHLLRISALLFLSLKIQSNYVPLFHVSCTDKHFIEHLKT